MPSIEELGRKMKEQFPGKFDHLSDRDLGLRFKKAKPNEFTEYKDEPMHSLAKLVNTHSSSPQRQPKPEVQLIESPLEVASKFLAKHQHTSITDKVMRQAEELLSFYNSKRGVFFLMASASETE